MMVLICSKVVSRIVFTGVDIIQICNPNLLSKENIPPYFNDANFPELCFKNIYNFGYSQYRVL